MSFSLSSLNPLSAISSAAESICDAVLPKKFEFVGDLVGLAADVHAGNWMGCLDDLQDFARDLPQQLGALFGHAREAGPSTDGTGAQPALEPTPPPPFTTTLPASVDSKPASTAETAGPSDATKGQATPATGQLRSVTSQLMTPAVAAAGASAKSASFDGFFALSDKALLDAVRDGKIPDSVAKDPEQMRRLQVRLNDISQMNQLITAMLAALHDMNKQVIQNLRV